MTKEQLKKAVIELERKEFFHRTRLDKLVEGVQLEFTDTGRYDEIMRHIHGHKYYINQSLPKEISFEEAMLSWYRKVYLPIVRLIKGERILSHFPGRTEADLYIWIVGHWDATPCSRRSGISARASACRSTTRFSGPGCG
jgi:hypothetical protein